MSSHGHEWTPHEREGWSVCSRCGKVRNYDREMTTCSGALPRIAVREDNETSVCSVCFRRVGINTGDDGTPPVDLGRCAAPGGFECRAVGQAVAGYRRENEVLRGWQWRPTATDTAFAPPFGTIRQCRVCGCLVAGGPTACARCAKAGV